MTRHNLYILHPFSPTKYYFEENPIPYNSYSALKFKKCTHERYKFRHYRSFQKGNKNTFWVKASYRNMEDSIDMELKGLFRGHPKLSKKSKNTSIGLKLEEICLIKVDNFCKIAKSQMCSKMHIFCQMGLTFYACTSLIT